MTFKDYKVYFARSAMGKSGRPVAQALAISFSEHGMHLPALNVAGEMFQMRDLQRVGRVWTGAFVKLRDDTPHVVTAGGEEQELDLQEGDRIIEKCYFLYREKSNVFVWQTNRASGGLTRAQDYLSHLFHEVVALPYVMNDEELEQKLSGQLYEIEFGYDRPLNLDNQAPRWNKNAFDMMSRVDAAYAKFTLRAPRRGGLLDGAKNMVRELVDSNGIKKVRIKMTDDSDPIELFMAPLKDTIRVEVMGRYPLPETVFEALEESYTRNRGSFA